MTPEQRIKQAKFIYGYLSGNIPSYREDTDKIKEIFGSYDLFKKASKIYWKYQTTPYLWNKADMSEEQLLYAMSPTSTALPVVDMNEWDLYKEYKDFILKSRFSRYEKNY